MNAKLKRKENFQKKQKKKVRWLFKREIMRKKIFE